MFTERIKCSLSLSFSSHSAHNTARLLNALTRNYISSGWLVSPADQEIRKKSPGTKQEAEPSPLPFPPTAAFSYSRSLAVEYSEFGDREREARVILRFQPRDVAGEGFPIQKAISQDQREGVVAYVTRFPASSDRFPGSCPLFLLRPPSADVVVL